MGRYKSRVNVIGYTHLPSYARMQREIRAHLANRYYFDVDMENCQPSLLLQALEHHELSSPLLKRYVENRDESLKQVMDSCEVSKDVAKNLFIRLLYFGRVEAWLQDHKIEPHALPQWVSEFQKELQESGARLADLAELSDVRAHCKRRQTANFLGSVVSYYLQTQERLCLDALVDAIQLDGRRLGGLIHDGVHVYKESDTDSLTPETLAKWSRCIQRKTGYTVRLQVKPFSCNPAWISTTAATLATESRPWELQETMTYEEMKTEWERSVCKILYPGGTYLRKHKNQNLLYSRQALVSAFEHVHYSSYTEKKGDSEGTLVTKKHSFLKNWMRDSSMRKYDRMDVYPPPLEAPADEFNLWTKFAVERYEPTREVNPNSDGVKALVNHVHLLLGREAAHTEYVLNWSAQMFQQPSVKTGIALLLKGEEGVGKNVFTNIFRALMGDEKFLETSKPASVLYGQFTSARRNKILICINEANGKENHANNDVLKDMITSETFVCEAKGENAVMLKCYDRFIFTTNNDNPVAVTPDSRRFVVFETSSELRGNTDYFRDLIKIVEDRHVQREFYEFLMQRDLKCVDWSRDRPRTGGFLRLVSNNAPYEYRFVYDMCARAHATGIEEVVKRSEELFEDFLEWMMAQRIQGHAVTALKFGRKLSGLIRNEKNSTGLTSVSKSKANYGALYHFKVDRVLEEMSERGWVDPADF